MSEDPPRKRMVKPPSGGDGGGRATPARLRTAKGRTHSSQAWLERQINDPFAAKARAQGYRSRAAFKLAEIDDKARLIKRGTRIIDLGAAPGGWSWQLASRGIRVTAIDNGPLAPSAIATGLIEHLRADGFTWKPKKAVDWLVCDMVEQPSRIAPLIADWFATGRCRRSIFNLKLPMKRRHDEVERCRALIDARLSAAGIKYILRIKHLYHDREEVTCYLTRR